MTSQVLLSFLGTSDYQPVTYNIDERSYNTCFFSHALAQHYPGYRLKVVMTNEAQAKHGAALNELWNFDEVLVPSGKAETELWEMFSCIAEAIPDNATLVIDVTHGFRSQPMLALAVVLYLRVVKRIELQRILYGAFEAKDAQGVAPAFDLTPFVTLIDWSIAAQQFSRYGNAAPLRDLVRKAASTGGQPRNSVLGLVGSRLDTISKALATIRPQDALTVAQHLAKEFDKFRQEVSRLDTTRPLIMLLDRIEARIQPLSEAKAQLFSPAGFQAQAAMIRFYLDTEQYPQAITLAREAYISHCCIAKGIKPDKKTDRETIESKLGALAHQLRNNKDSLSEAEIELAQFWHHVTEMRNDVNHAGMGRNPQPTQATLEKIQKLCAEIIDRITA